MRSVRVVLPLVLSMLGSMPVTTAAAQGNAAATVACQLAIGKGGTTFVASKLKLLDTCAGPLFKCFQTVPEDLDADVDPLERCLEQANKKCVKAADKIVAEGDKLLARIVAACGALGSDDLFGAAGVGFDAIAAECAPLIGVAPTDAAGIGQCLLFQYDCQVERLFQAERPRAGELFAYTEADIGTTCLEDLGGDGAVPDPKLGKSVDKCGKAIGTKGAAFAVRKMKGIAACSGALFTCAEADPSDACRAKAQAVCDKELGAIDAMAAKLGPAIEKACGKVPFATLAPENGIFSDALGEECDGYGIAAVASLADYASCIHRNHECQTDELVRFAVPRAAELLDGVGRTLPGKAFCVPEETP